MLAEWMTALTAARVLTDTREAMEAQLGPWLSALEAAGAGDDAAKGELLRLVALYGRALGAEGKPASAAVLQVALLDRAFRGRGPISDHLSATLDEMLRVIADAHDLGATQRLRQRNLRALRESSPVFRWADRAVIGFLIGGMEAELVDAMFGRVLRECAGAGVDHAVIDVFGAPPDDQLFHHTIRGFADAKELDRYHLTITGLRDPEATRRALDQLGVDRRRVTLLPDLQRYLSDSTAS